MQSISECKNGGDCTINKKNRTACKACRLRKCLLVGMSKSGSRYGRRSNWFKINFLLQEEQQKAVQAAAAAAAAANANNDHLKSSSAQSAQSALNLFGPSSYPAALSYARAKENMKMLGYDDYSSSNGGIGGSGGGGVGGGGGGGIGHGNGGPNSNHPMPSPSVSSPDSHNSDSSIEISDRHATSNATTKQSLTSSYAGNNNSHSHSHSHSIVDSPYTSLPFNKELFLPLSYPGFVPAPGFLPPQSSHLLFPGYQALFAPHQGLLKPAIDPSLLMHPSHILANNNSRFMPNHNSKNAAEELSKYYLNAVLKSQRTSSGSGEPQSTNGDDNEIDENSERIAASATDLTPQSLIMKRSTTRSPYEYDSIKRMKTVSPTPSTSSARSASISSASVSSVSLNDATQDTPIDLSMKSTRSLSPNDDSHSRSSSSVQCTNANKSTTFNGEPAVGLQMIAGRT